MKKGFTMVELIAIIILLAVISLVSFPTINNIIKTTQINNDKQLVQSIIDDATVLYNEYVFKNKHEQLINKNIYDSITTPSKPTKGILIINDYGDIKVSIKIEDRCYKKEFLGEIVLYDDSTCGT